MLSKLENLLYLLFVTTQVANAKDCTSVNIRNEARDLNVLKGCSVVEGFVMIVLMENTTEADFLPYSFPELKEITQYLMFFRVKGLRSLGTLFPNLEKIGGDNLFQERALIIHEMFNLEDVGLSSLREITRGFVIFHKNPNLCYVNTVDWDNITRWDGGIKNYFSNNKDPNSCPACAEDCQGHCWNSTHCQINPDKSSNGKCHSLCVGGCNGTKPSDCYSCRGVLGPSGDCLEKCSNNTYVYLNRRCITKEQCLATNVTLDYSNGEDIGHLKADTIKNYLTFNGECLNSCPAGFEVTHDNQSCRPCRGRCIKFCKGAKIERVDNTRELKGCTHIESLEISIKSGNSQSVYSELEENLGSIEEISGYLKLVRSTISDLSFLKNLSAIRGNDKQNNYTLYILDNQNLQELWNWESKKNFTVNGRLFFHYNPKLCLSHIYKLLEVINYDMYNISDFEINKMSNGDKFPCKASEINVTVTYTTIELIQINVPYLDINGDSELRYVLYYTKDPYRNVSIYDELDQCSDYNWKAQDISVERSDITRGIGQSSNTRNGFQFNITNLEPATQYAFYVTTFTINGTNNMSNMSYVSTLPSIPSELTYLHAYSSSPSEVVLRWKPPLKINGKLENYVVTWYPLSEDKELLQTRDYCKHPMDAYTTEQQELTSTSTVGTVKSDKNCCEKKTTSKLDYTEKEGLEELCSAFESTELPLGFPERTKFSSCESYFYSYISKSPFQSHSNHYKNSELITEKDTGMTNEIAYEIDTDQEKWGYLKQQYKKYTPQKQLKNKQHLTKRVPASSAELTIPNLKHFQNYVFMVKACREKHPKEKDPTEEMRCSQTEIVTIRTQQNESADDITGLRLNVDRQSVTIWWNISVKPNGLIVAFNIEYYQRFIETPKHVKDCITYNEYENNKRSHSITELSAGIYELRIQAISLAGLANFTSFERFEIKGVNILQFRFIPVAVFLLVTIALLCTASYIFRLKKRKTVVVIAAVNPNYEYIADHYEIDRGDVEFKRELGVGSFGKVYEGVLKSNNTSCAIKTVSDYASQDNENEFLIEATVMKSLVNSHYIVNLIGVVSKGKPPLVLMELMELGDLKSYLRSVRDSHPLSTATMINMALQIGDAMAFMESHKFVHRDLAARNCMVSADLTIKVGDFGMARDIYETDYYRKKNKGFLPIRWMAPESLKDGEFTSQSDVWSYGVVLWEIMTMAEQPYQGYSNDEVLHEVIAGMRLEIPKNTPLPLKNVLLSSWKSKPSNRHSFMQLVGNLEYYHDEEFKRLSFYHGEEAAAHRRDTWEYVEMQSVEDPLLGRLEPQENGPVAMPRNCPYDEVGAFSSV